MNKETEALIDVLLLFKNHLSTMNDINAHMGYKFTQPLIKTHQSLIKIVEEKLTEKEKRMLQ